LNRTLAVKTLLKSRGSQADLKRRFQEEAQITGQLQHPGIPPIHEIGVLPDGRPFFAMKLIKGQSLAELLHQRRQPSEGLPRLLAIFVHVCQTLAYAHSKRVIHRDLKPSNVMVGKFGEVQVMDWGLAKVLGTKDAAAESEERVDAAGRRIQTEADSVWDLTRSGCGFGTPAYMPPEQALGEWDAVDERADVFALGSILCELLTGAPAYRGSDGAEVYRRAKRGDASEARERLQQCGADATLIALCQECLSPEVAGRPRDAEVVAKRVADYQAAVQERLRQAELERVAAQTRAREEQARAVVEQERAQEALARAAAERRARRRTRYLAGALLVLLVGGVVAIVVVNRERQLTATALSAEKQRRVQARAALDAMSSEVIDDWLAKQNQLSDEQKKYLEKALASYEEFAQDTGQEEEARRGLAWAYLRIAKIRHSLGQAAKAEEAYRRSQEQFARLVAEFPSGSEYREGLGLSRYGMGALLSKTRRSKEGEAAFQDALAVFTQAAADFPANPGFRQKLSDCHFGLASCLRLNRRSKEAEAEYRHALAITKQLVDEFPDNVEYGISLSRIHFDLSLEFVARQHWTEAETHLRASLALSDKLVARFPTRTGFRYGLAWGYSILGAVLTNLDRLSEARDACRKALPLLKQLADDFPNRPIYQSSVAAALIRLAEASMTKEPEQAGRLLEEALVYSRVAVEAEPDNMDYLFSLYQNYHVQIQVFLQLRDHARAAAAAEAAEPASHTVESLYGIVGAYVECMTLAGEDAKLSQDKRKELRNSYGDRAMNALRRAVEFGYKDVVNLQKDKQLDPLRERDDFKKLLAELEKKTR
jgi:tetratricopeptide (TPR) repeat protein